MKVCKYPLESSTPDLFIPDGGEVLSVQVQDGKPCIWALVDDSKSEMRRRFKMYGTGKNLEDPVNEEYVGTFQLNGFVFHLFEVQGV